MGQWTIPETQGTMLGLLGRHEFRIDEKGRVSFPSAFRRAVSPGPLVLLQWQETHLDLFPAETWDRIRQNLLDHRKRQQDGGVYLRRITSSAAEVEPDSAGRILIPGWLREGAALGPRVLFVGAVDRVELWNPTGFEEQVVREVPDDGFAAQIFG